MPVYDFHTHTFLSDGVLSPIELIRRAHVRGYRAIAITDHAAEGGLEWVLHTLVKDCALANSRWDILALPGVELTHVPPEDIDRLAQEARRMGARVVVVHGETIVEPVEPGTNRAGIMSGADILSHPGLISRQDAALAAKRGVYLEITARKGHSLCNGHVADMAAETGAKLVLNTDSHEPGDLINDEFALQVLAGVGLDKKAILRVLQNSREIVNKTLGG